METKKMDINKYKTLRGGKISLRGTIKKICEINNKNLSLEIINNFFDKGNPEEQKLINFYLRQIFKNTDDKKVSENNTKILNLKEKKIIIEFKDLGEINNAAKSE